MPNIDNTSNKPYNKVVRFEAVGWAPFFGPTRRNVLQEVRKMISTGIVRSIDSLRRVSCPRNSAPPTILLRIPRWRFLPMGIPSLCASTTRRAAAFSAATFLPTPCCSTANTSAPSAARHWASKARSPCYIPAYTKKPVQANCTGSYFWFYSAFFSPRMASSAFLRG